MKQDLMDSVGIFLLKEGYMVKSLTRSCFDLLARKQDRILLLKLLEDANSVTKEAVHEMNTVAGYMAATPFIIAQKAQQDLEDNVLYTRFGMNTLNDVTFQNCIKNKSPFVKRTQAGLTVSLDGIKLRQQREAKGFSLTTLSHKLGVSDRMISKYEQGQAEITLQKAMKVYDLFGDHVFHHIDLFDHDTTLKINSSSVVSKKYTDLGFSASETQKSPFDIIARKDNELILTEVGDKIKPDAASLSRLLDADQLVIFDKKKPKDIPAITKKEFLEFQRSNDLIKFLKEF